ncbi:GIY-YIG nuclease family protein [Dokdonia donghaensis]|uniref:Endonuclease n=1 Tax=Dokdonia donghaensis DSW-1 TaxID=1300343 RepID=A0A0A2GYJ5_9FLAO|nr:GIY-YIG nuclease family protein [Dokdonia donghaensis]ANH60349.1 GIY-YIG nuclease superfamily protein [Dokdonia donghaensis DSW-1]KGO07628.1 endonuclease [Dokdonia donghaensis DSW-1]
MEPNQFYTYIITNKNNTVLYLGFTDNLKRRINQYKSKSSKGFSGKYNTEKLVWFEVTQYVENAIKREKQIKKWNREWKENLINDMNPKWEDLYWML